MRSDGAYRPNRPVQAGRNEHAEQLATALHQARSDNVIAENYRLGAYLYDVLVFLLQLLIGGVWRWRASFVRLIDPRPGERIAELCCGTASVALRLARRVRGCVWASDLSPEQIRVARLKAQLLRRNVELSVKDASATGYPSASFDKVVISGALHEISPERREAIYAEVRRVTKPSGSFYVSEPDRPRSGWGRACFDGAFGPWNAEHSTAVQLIEGGLEQELKRAGLRVVRHASSNFGFFHHREATHRTSPGVTTDT